jgi:hypothetical protein
MNRWILAVGAVVVMGAAIGLWLWMRHGDDAQANPQRTSAEVAGSEVATPTVRATSGTSVTPTLPDGDRVAAGTDSVKEYKVGDVRVRDHRKGDHPPMDLPPNSHPPDGRKIASTVTADIAQKVRAVMNECVASIPREARGVSPRLEGLISIAIKDKQVSVTAATIQLRDIVGASIDPTKQCIETKSIGITTPADEPDLADYTINLSFAVP